MTTYNENVATLREDVKKFQKEVTEKSRELWLAGLGFVSEVEDKGQAVIKDLDGKRDDLQAKGKKLEDKLVAFGNDRKEQVNQTFKDTGAFLGKQVQEVMTRFGYGSKTEIEDLKVKIEQLSKTLENLSGELEAKAPAVKTARKRTTKSSDKA